MVTFFTPDAFVVADAIDDAVHHQERIAVGQDAHHLVDVQHALAGREWMTAAGTIERIRGYSALSVAAILVLGPWPGFTAMTWPRMRTPESIRSPMRSSALWRANSLVKRIGFLGHDLVAADDHRAFQRAALDQAFFQQRLDVLVIDEGAGRRRFPSRRLPG